MKIINRHSITHMITCLTHQILKITLMNLIKTKILNSENIKTSNN